MRWRRGRMYPTKKVSRQVQMQVPIAFQPTVMPSAFLLVGAHTKTALELCPDVLRKVP
jgi:hypothetical protein